MAESSLRALPPGVVYCCGELSGCDLRLARHPGHHVVVVGLGAARATAAGQDEGDAHVRDVVAALRSVPRVDDRLDRRGFDADTRFHRDTYFDIFADAGLDDALAHSLYAVELIPSTTVSPKTLARRCASCKGAASASRWPVTFTLIFGRRSTLPVWEV